MIGTILFFHILQNWASNKTERQDKFLSVFTVVKFPNDACGSTSGLNGTCYTSSQCESLGGSSSGSCASSFGVCCVFSLSCGGSSSQNNTYATMTSYTVSSDPDPCTYTFCKSNSDVCKLRIDYETFQIAGPTTYDATVTAADAYKYGMLVGDCTTDTLSISNPGGAVPPIICGINTGQHMWVPASDQCNMMTFDLDTGNSGTTRTWQIKVTQYECNVLSAPEQDCLQWHTAQTGRTSSFNWDYSATAMADTQHHLSNQKYDICFRRARGFCSVCFSMVLHIATDRGSYGLGGGSDDTVAKGALDSQCSGETAVGGAIATGIGLGDWLNIQNMQNSPAAAIVTTPAVGPSKVCGEYFSATASSVVHNTVCTFTTPFKIGVHFDDDESHFLPTALFTNIENAATYTAGAGPGWAGFWFDYWQNSC